MEVKIFAVTHKEVAKVANDRILIGVGANKPIKGVEVYDDTGDNIAEKNSSFCELTALYWMWKNIDCEYIGLEHYRRFFADDRLFSSKPISAKALIKKMKKSDVVLPAFSTSKETVADYYAKEHVGEDLTVCGEIIAERYPEYSAEFNAVCGAHKACMTNMFVMKKQLADEYCAWLFDILFEAEKRIDYSDRDAYQQRVFGFLSERLFNVWLMKKQLKISTLLIHDFNVGGWLPRKIRGGFRRLKRLFGKKN